MFEQIISKDDINTARQYEFDIAKGFAIIFMVIVHIFLVCAHNSQTTLKFVIDDILGGPLAAPVFMTCLGIGVCFSRNATPAKLFKRGLSLFATAYILNIFRMVLPYIFVLPFIHNFDLKFAIILLIGMDILQFAGLAFIFISLIKKLKISFPVIFVIAIVFSLLGTVFTNGNYLQTNFDILNQFIGMFLPSKTILLDNEDIAFPFCNWIIFPLFGLLFGTLIRKIKDKTKFYAGIFVFSSILTIIYVLINIKYGLLSFSGGSFYHIDILSALFYSGIILLCFSIDYFLLNIMSDKIKNIFVLLSKHINSIYCIHWVLIGWCAVVPFLFLNFKVPNEFILLISSIVLIYVSTLLAVFWTDKIKPKFKKQ